MAGFFAYVVVFLSLCVWPHLSYAQQGEKMHGVPSLQSEYAQIDGKAPFTLLFRLNLDDHWHSYWQNPGDSGLETEITWELPDGFTASDIIWQPPHRLTLGPLTNFGYEDDAYHLVKITPPDNLPDGSQITLKAEASWLVCMEICIPESTTQTLTLTVGDENVASDAKTLVDKLTQSAYPQELSLKGVRATEKEITLAIMPPKGAKAPKEAYFYPTDGGLIDHAAAQSVKEHEGAWLVAAARGIGDVPSEIAGFLEVGKGAYYRVKGEAKDIPEAVAAMAAQPKGAAIGLLAALGLAFLGGVALNAMPCVFPVLSLKALAIAKKSDKERGVVRLHGLAYALGCLSFFAVIGGSLLALKSMGNEIGWGYQMQSPLFVALLAMLVFAVSLNLAGFLSFNFGIGYSGSGKENFTGTYATGALAVLVATPCTAPFMATALGAALSFTPAAAMGVFLALGAGLAFPYILIAGAPGALRFLPKPGAWMESFKEALAFPMLLTCIWLLWILTQQTGANGVSLWGVSAVGLCFLIWLNRRWGLRRPTAKLMFLIGLSVFIYPFFGIVGTGATEKTLTLTSVPYSEKTLNQALDNKRSVFVYATASWCITCKVNERMALESAKTLKAFAEADVLTLKADWTNADATITKYLERFGRNGVPLYVYYPSGGKPVILPQLLTPSIVVDHVSRQ